MSHEKSTKKTIHILLYTDSLGNKKTQEKYTREKERKIIDWFHIIVFYMFSDEAVQLIYL